MKPPPLVPPVIANSEAERVLPPVVTAASLASELTMTDAPPVTLPDTAACRPQGGRGVQIEHVNADKGWFPLAAANGAGRHGNRPRAEYRAKVPRLVVLHGDFGIALGYRRPALGPLA